MRQHTPQGVDQRRNDEQRRNHPLDISRDLAHTERQRLLRLNVEDRVRRRVDLESRNQQVYRIGAVQRIDYILVGIHHLRHDAVDALLEGPKQVTLAKCHAAAVALERIDRHIFDERVWRRPLTPERREEDTLHQILVHLYRIYETVAYAYRVGFDAAPYNGGIVVDGGRRQIVGTRPEGRRRQRGEQYRENGMSHRCLNSLINSTT